MNKEKLEKLASEGNKEAQMELAESLSVRDRLLRRLEKNTVFVPFTDDLGEFLIEIKLLNPKELDAVGKMYGKLVRHQIKAKQLGIGKAKENTEKQDTLIAEGNAIMGELYGWVQQICVDQSLTKEYWEEGVSFTIDVPLALLRIAMAESQKAATDIRSFRKNEPRKGSISVPNGNP